MPTAASTIIERGFVELPVDPIFLMRRMADVIAGMKRVTESPIYENLFPWRILSEDAYGPKYGQEVGLVRRDDEEQKYIFHYATEARFDLVPGVKQDKTLAAFFLALEELGAAAMKNAIKVAQSYDEINASSRLYSGSMAERFRRGRAITRILRYLRPKEGRADAFPHLDRSGLTNHWFGTHPGLAVLTEGGAWSRVDETSPASCAMFPGRKIAAISGGKLGWGTLHGVKYERAEGDEDRISCISFVHPAPNNEEATWLLEHDAEIKAYERSFKL